MLGAVHEPEEGSCSSCCSIVLVEVDRRRFAPHQLRHAHAVEMAGESVPLIVIQRQLGHSNLGITSVYLQGIDNAEIIETVHAGRASMIPVSASLRLLPTAKP
jgi:integrase